MAQTNKNQKISYVELHACSPFSFLRGGSTADELFETASELGYKALGICDVNTLSGIVRAHVAAKKTNVRLLVGSHITFVKDIPEKPFEDVLPIPQLESLNRELDELQLPLSLLLFPENLAGYKNLCALLTRGKMRAEKGKCYLQITDLKKRVQHLQGVVIVHDTKCPSLSDHLKTLRLFFKDDSLSLAVSKHYGPRDRESIWERKEIAQSYQIPLVAINSVLYHGPERKALQDVMTCIRHRTTLKDAGFLLQANAENYLKCPGEMTRLFREIPEAIRRTSDIASRLSFSLDEVRYEYPEEICPKDISPLEYLKKLVWEGAKTRYKMRLPGKVLSQLKHEFELIHELGYEKYFLTVYDIVQFARSKNILCQGRGAAANSAVCYCLGITAVDPDKVNLLFERFVSKERNEPPDIDVDFEHERREEVIQYIYNKFGRHRAALAAEVVTYRTRSAVRDVGKVFSLPLEDIENVIRLLQRMEGTEPTEEEFKRFDLDANNSIVLQTIALSQEIKGFPRHLSQHVGGFIISDPPLSELVPIENASMANRTVIEWDKNDIEALGMLKIDVLALGMLTCIRKALEFLTEGKNIHQALLLHQIPPEDSKVYDMICQADTIGVFQIESRAQMSMLPRLRPRCFYDLVIEVAIVRPGPIQGGMVHPFLRRRMGKEPVTYPNREIKKILHTTLGVPIFQEQIMEIAITAAGFTPGEAEALRRAMASWKWDKQVIKTFGPRIIKGMLENGYSRSYALTFIEQMKGFSEYGFPQSHAASFALLVYVSSWIKCYHPAIFAAALINSQPMGFYRPAQIIEDAKRHGVEVRPVDVNYSSWDCTIEGKFKALRLGFRLVRGLKESEARKIPLAVKEHGRFTSIQTLWRRSGVKVSALKALAHADCFRSLQLNRQKALWEIRTFRDELLTLFEDQKEREPEPKLPLLKDIEHVVRDYDAVGLSLKAHPLSFLRPQLLANGVSTAHTVKNDRRYSNNLPAIVAGIVIVRQQPLTASGVVFVTLEDETGLVNLIIKPEVFKEHRDAICDSVFLLAKGRVQRESNVVHLMVNDARDISPVFEQMSSQSRDFH